MHRAALTRSAAFSIPLARSAHAGKLYRTRDNRFLRVNDAQALNDPEMAVVGLGDVRVHANVMLTGHHFSRTARPLGDLGMVKRLDHVVLLERASLFHGGLPELYAAIEAGARTAGGELGVARKELVVPIQQSLAEWITGVLVIVEAAVHAFDVFGRHVVHKVLVHVC